MDEDKKVKGRAISIKMAVILAVILVVGALAYVYRGVFIAATVNGTPISRLSVIKEVEKNYGKNALDAMITQKLIHEEAASKDIKITDEEINSTISEVESSITSQGSTLAAALAAQGMDMDEFKRQIIVQKEVEKLLEGKINVTDEEIDAYIADNQVQIPAGEEESYRNQVRSILEGDKFSAEAQKLVESLKSTAKIKYFVEY